MTLEKLHSTTFKKATTTKFAGNTYSAYQNEGVPFLHVTWPSHTKVIKARVTKLALMKDTHPFRSRDPLIMWYSDKWKVPYHNFCKCFKVSHLKRKKDRMKFICPRFKDYMVNAASWNKLKVVHR